MKVFLDTNIFYNDWFMRNANFKYLFHFINNEDYDFFISELVIEEVENKRSQELKNKVNDLEKSIKNINKLSKIVIDYEVQEFKNEDYDFLDLLEEKINNISIISYENISQKEVVQRALKHKKPFLQGEKGYRDTLIWLSFLEYIKLNKIEEDVVFITANKSDFFEPKSTNLEFYKELLNDIEEREIKCSINPFLSLSSFVESTIDKQKHAIDYNNSDIEWYLENESISILNVLSDSLIIEYLENVSYLNIDRLNFPNIESIHIELMEGLEDEEPIGSRELPNNEIYIQYEYNLRRVSIEIEINKLDYKNIYDRLHIIREDDNNLYLGAVVRIYYISSFIYNSETRVISDFVVNDFYFE